MEFQPDEAFSEWLTAGPSEEEKRIMSRELPLVCDDEDEEKDVSCILFIKFLDEFLQ